MDMTIRLIALGGLRCTHGGDELDWLARKWLSGALLLYLAVERRATREHLLAMFWPDHDDSRAGRRLNQALYSLRSGLGSDCIRTNGFELIAGDDLQSDVVDFERFEAAGRHKDAVSLYGGPFLSGVHLAPQLGFETWVDQRRARCAQLFRNACRTSLEERLAAGDVIGAIALARRWVTPDPLDDEAQHRLIDLLAGSGARAEALAQYDLYTRGLAQDDLTPLEKTKELVTRIRRGETDATQSRHNGKGESASPSDAEPAEALKTAYSGSAATDESVPGSAPATDRPFGSRSSAFRMVPPRRLRLVMSVVVLLGALGVTVRWPSWSPTRDVELDAHLVAVLPFRVNGAESSLSYLREGMVELLAARLAAESGPRAVDPRALTNVWQRVGGADGADLTREQAVAVAREAGAGRLVLGEVVSLPGRVVLTAVLHDVATGRSELPVSAEGPSDSLLALVDRLVAGLLSMNAGERERLASLTTTSLPALRRYLAGQSAYRGGRPAEGLSNFSRALEIDTTFALAALMRWRARARVGGGDAGEMISAAWRHRDRLGYRDRAFLDAVVGPNWPGFSSAADRIASRQALAEQQPDNPDAWFLLGDGLPGAAAALGIPDSTALRRAAHAFSRALELDSAFLPALESLGSIALVLGDTADARRHADHYLELAPTGLEAETVRCRFAASARGVAALTEILARIDSEGGDLANRCLRWLHGIPAAAEVRDSLAEHLHRQFEENPEILGRVDWRLLGWTLHRVAHDRGRPRAATRYVDALRRTGQLDSLGYLVTRIGDGLYWDGESDAAARAATALAARLARMPAEPNGASGDALCVLGQWRLAQGDTAGVIPVIARLHSLRGTADSWEEARALRCAEMLRTWHGVATGSSGSAARLARVEVSLSALGAMRRRMYPESNLVLARLLEAQGDFHGAQRVLDAMQIGTLVAYGSIVLRERGRIALQRGDTLGAAENYRRYLAMRADPEPELLPEVQRIRVELAQLTRPAGPKRAR